MDSLRENADGRGFYFNCVIIYDLLCSVFWNTDLTDYFVSSTFGLGLTDLHRFLIVASLLNLERGWYGFTS